METDEEDQPGIVDDGDHTWEGDPPELPIGLPPEKARLLPGLDEGNEDD